MKIIVALLPPTDVWKQIVELNNQAMQGITDPAIVLGDEAKPHVTIIHTDIEDRSLGSIHELVGRRLTSLAPLALKPEKLSIEVFRNVPWLALIFRPDPILHQIHHDLMDQVRPFESDQTTYRTNFSYEHYYPHFTIGSNISKLPRWQVPEYIRFVRVGLCERGNHGTCGRIIAEWKLVNTA